MLERLKRNKNDTLTVAPFVNIYEKEGQIILDVEMPGADKGSLDVHLEGNQLRIYGRKMKDDIGKEFKMLYQERATVEYERAFELNTEVDREHISAQYNNGILRIELRKAQSALPKKIQIKT